MRSIRPQLLLALAVLVSSPFWHGDSPVAAQCAIVYSADVSPSPNIAAVRRVFSGSAVAVMCTPTSANNVGCFSANVASGMSDCTNPMSCKAITGYVIGVTTNPQSHTCQFDCGVCGTQRIDNSDGLPVELMEFFVDGNDSVDGEER